MVAMHKFEVATVIYKYIYIYIYINIYIYIYIYIYLYITVATSNLCIATILSKWYHFVTITWYQAVFVSTKRNKVIIQNSVEVATKIHFSRRPNFYPLLRNNCLGHVYCSLTILACLFYLVLFLFCFVLFLLKLFLCFCWSCCFCGFLFVSLFVLFSFYASFYFAFLFFTPLDSKVCTIFGSRRRSNFTNFHVAPVFLAWSSN